MRKTMLMLLAVALSTAAFAQTNPAGAGQTDLKAAIAKIKPSVRLKLANGVLQRMSLSPSQRSKISALEEKLKGEVMKIRAEGKADPNPADKPARRQRILDLDKAFHADLLKVLSPAERKEFRSQMRSALEKTAKSAGS